MSNVCRICGIELHENAIRNGHDTCIKCRRNGGPVNYWNGAGNRGGDRR